MNTRQERNLFGFFLYPPSHILEESLKILPPIKNGYRSIIINKKITPKIQILVTDDCFICPITDNYKTSVEVVNVLFSLLTTKNTKAQVVTNNDVCPASWIQDSNHISIWSRLGSSLRNLQETKRVDNYEEWIQIKRQHIHKHLMEILIDQAVRFMYDMDFKNNLLIIGESSRIFNENLFGSSFLSSWIVVESIIEKIWNEFVKQLERKSVERDALKNHHSWTTSHFIESLSFAEKLNQDAYDCLTKLRKIRNDIIHRKKREITEENAWNCLNVAICLTYNQLNRIDPFDSVVYKEIENKNDSQRSE